MLAHDAWEHADDEAYASARRSSGSTIVLCPECEGLRTALERRVRSKAQSLLRGASSGMTLSPTYATNVVALLRHLCACVTPAGDFALRGESDAANHAEAAEEAAREASEHAVDEAREREAVEHEGFRPRRASE